MSLPIRTRAQADADLLEARAWYDAQQAGRGAAFFEAVSATVRHIADMPLAYPRVADETRRARLLRYPYSIFYQVRADHILVIAIMHDSRDPRHWQSRS